jgi:hypothetical protein
MPQRTPAARLTGTPGKILLLLASLAFAVAAAEVGFRALARAGAVDYPDPPLDRALFRYSAIPEMIYEMKPDASAVGGMVRTNSYGMRDREYARAKPPGTTRICVLGDSVSFGANLPLEQTFPKLLERRLNEGSSRRYEVLSFSVVGYNSLQEELLLTSKVLEFQPDVVLLSYVPNDDTYTDGIGELARQMSPHSLGAKLRSRLLSYLLYRWERHRFEKWDDVAKVWSLLDALSRTSRERRFGVVVLLNVYLENYAAADPGHEAVKAQALVRGFDVVDLKEPWKGVPREQAAALFDRTETHYSALGMAEVTEHLLRFFRGKGFA